MEEKIFNEKIDSVAKFLIPNLIRDFFISGDLTEVDLELTQSELLIKLKSIIAKTELLFTVDHRDRILQKAENHLQAEELEFSKIFYAMFFEHTLNKIIHFQCGKKNINSKTKNDIVRSIDINGKLTWLLVLLGFKPFNVNHIKTIKKLSEDRNAFIHYKWNPESDDFHNQLDKVKLSEFKSIKLAVRYMKIYESNILYQKSKGKIMKKAKQGFKKTVIAN